MILDKKKPAFAGLVLSNSSKKNYFFLRTTFFLVAFFATFFFATFFFVAFFAICLSSRNGYVVHLYKM